jgi:glutathione S-transferase
MVPLVSGFVAPEAERDNWGARWGLEIFHSRIKLVARQLARSPYIAGDAFTAADISVTYALELAQRHRLYAPDETVRAYLARTTARDGYKRAMDACRATKAWVESLPAI